MYPRLIFFDIFWGNLRYQPTELWEISKCFSLCWMVYHRSTHDCWGFLSPFHDFLILFLWFFYCLGRDPLVGGSVAEIFSGHFPSKHGMLVLNEFSCRRPDSKRHIFVGPVFLDSTASEVDHLAGKRRARKIFPQWFLGINGLVEGKLKPETMWFPMKCGGFSWTIFLKPQTIDSFHRMGMWFLGTDGRFWSTPMSDFARMKIRWNKSAVVQWLTPVEHEEMDLYCYSLVYSLT